MKRCPACNTTYTDESLRYCLTDGTTLESAEQETFVRAAGTNPLRVDIPRADTVPDYRQPMPEKKSGSLAFKIVLALVIIGVLGLALVAIIGGVAYFSMAPINQNPRNTTPLSSPTGSPTVDPEKQRLQDELANAQKKLEEQKNTNTATRPPAFPTPGQPDQPGVVTARVDSPGDGFLAMRSEPSADYGERVAKIPHGATVNIENCQRDRIRIGVRTGRWCMVTWGDHVGWVFDAWLVY